MAQSLPCRTRCGRRTDTLINSDNRAVHERQLRELAEKHPAEIEIATIDAYVQYRGRNYKRSIGLLSKLIVADKGEARAYPYYLRGACLLEEHKYAESLADVDHAISLEPYPLFARRPEDPYITRAQLRETFFQPTSRDYQMAAKLNPNSFVAARNLSPFALGMGTLGEWAKGLGQQFPHEPEAVAIEAYWGYVLARESATEKRTEVRRRAARVCKRSRHGRPRARKFITYWARWSKAGLGHSTKPRASISIERRFGNMRPL